MTLTKTYNTRFIARKVLFFGFLLLLGGLVPLFCFSATIVTEDFNDYTAGQLQSQGDWVGSANYYVESATTSNPEGAVGKQALIGVAGDHTISINGTSLTDGTTSWYVMTKNHTNWGTGRQEVFAISTSGSGWVVHPSFSVVFDQAGYIKHNNGNITTYNDDEWILVEAEWRSSPDYKFRVRINGGTWTGWETGYGGNWTAGLGKFGIEHYIATNDRFYFDYIAEEPIPSEFEVFITNPATDYEEFSTNFDLEATITGFPYPTYDTLAIQFTDWNSQISQWYYEGFPQANATTSYEVATSTFWRSTWLTTLWAEKTDCDDWSCTTTRTGPANGPPETDRWFILTDDFSTSVELVLDIPEFVYPDTWETYEEFYASTSDRWSTSTGIGLVLNNSIGAITNWLFNLSSQLQNLNVERETAGQTIGLAIRGSMGYLETIDNFFSGFPLSGIFIGYIIVLLLVLMLRLIKYIRGMVPGRI